MYSTSETVTLAAPVVRLTEQKSEMDMVESVIAQAMRDGAQDMTAFEAMQAVQRVYGVSMWPGTVSRVVAQLKAAGRVIQDKKNRRLSRGPGASHVPSARLTVPVRQVEAFY